MRFIPLLALLGVRTTPIRVDWRDEQQFAFDPAEVRMPTLLIYGARDPLYSPEGASNLFAQLGTQDRALVLLAEADHAAHLEDPEGAWLKAITDFLERPRSSNPGREK